VNDDLEIRRFSPPWFAEETEASRLRRGIWPNDPVIVRSASSLSTDLVSGVS
jgi:hypothetical protein